MLKGFLNNIGENNMNNDIGENNLKIVEFGDGKYGVMRWNTLFENNEFLDVDVEDLDVSKSPFWGNKKSVFYCKSDTIEKYCKFDTIDDAKKARIVYLEKVKQDKLKKTFKIIE
jgi:hypothetical protein